MSLFFAKPHETVFVNIAKPEPIVAGLYTIDPVTFQRGGTQRYYQRPRLKPTTRDAVLVIIKLILLLPLLAGYSHLLPCGAMDRNSKNTLNYWASMASVVMLAELIVLLILGLIILIRLQVKSVWELILKCNIAFKLSKVIQQFKEAQEVCERKIIEQTLVVIATMHATPCRGRQDIAEWILINVIEHALISDSRYTGVINVMFNKALQLAWSIWFETTRLAQLIDLLPTRYIAQEQQSLVPVSFFATWSLPQWANRNDELVNTLREVQQRAHSRAEAVADWISEKMYTRQTLDDASCKKVINQIITMARAAHRFSVVALAIALAEHVIAIANFVTVNPMLRLL